MSIPATKIPTNSSQPFWLDQILTTSDQLPYQGDFDIQGLKINIHGYDPEIYLWVEKYLYPLNLSAPSNTELSYRINFLHCDDLVLAALNTIENNEIDTRRISNARRSLDRICVSKQITVDCDPFYGMLWVTDRSTNSITVVLSAKVRWPFLEISRVVRDLITRFLEDKGWILFHAGAIQSNEKNYLVIGDASAGKTSFIIAMLYAGSAFISNERVFVKLVDGRAQMLSFPMPIAVGLGTMVQYPELIKFIRQPQYCQYPPRRINFAKVHNTPEWKWPELEDKIQFLPQELSRQFSDISGVPGGNIDGVIVPCRRKRQIVVLESLDKKTIGSVVTHNCIDRSHDEIYPPWMPLPFQQPSSEDIKQTISFLENLPNSRIAFSGDKNRRNEIKTYPERIFKALVSESEA